MRSTIETGNDGGSTCWIVPSPDAGQFGSGHIFPSLGEDDVRPVNDGLVYWDAWPLLTTDGAIYIAAGGNRLWFALAAPRRDDPDARHAEARIHLLAEHDGQFAPLGPALPDEWSPGSREWSGGAIIDPSNRQVTLAFTAAGRRGEAEATFEQRMFRTTGELNGARVDHWSAPEELICADDRYYQRVVQPTGEIGKIKAFRDPDLFRDPADGRSWTIFTASSAKQPGDFDGVIGASVDGVTLPPLIDGTGVNNELERPHVRLFDGAYYLFWSTQAHVFAPDSGGWPTGLYGAVANSMAGPWQLLNGSGLVAANPPESPAQAYSWLVLPDRTVTSFVDRWGDPDARNFGGTFAPFVTLALDGSSATVES